MKTDGESKIPPEIREEIIKIVDERLRKANLIKKEPSKQKEPSREEKRKDN